MRRLSIRTIMAAVVIAAVGLAALRNANELWAGMMLLTTLAMLGIATLGIIFLRAKEQAWWAGQFESVGHSLFARVAGLLRGPRAAIARILRGQRDCPLTASSGAWDEMRLA